MKYQALFINAELPGQVLRYIQRHRQVLLLRNSVLLSDAVGAFNFRCLLISNGEVDKSCAIGGTKSLANTLSYVFPPRVTLLWRHASVFPDPAKWGFTVWDNGEVVETAEHVLPPDPKPTLLSRLPGMKRNLPHSPDIAWALARGLPIDRVPAAGLRRNIRLSTTPPWRSWISAAFLSRTRRACTDSLCRKRPQTPLFSIFPLTLKQ
jgi:hypothetical protein